MMKKVKKVIFLSLILVLFISNSLTTYGLSFEDMPQGWSKPALEAAVANGLLLGSEGKIMPEKEMTRAELATIIVKVLGLEERADLSSFKDVKEDAWYYDSISKAVSSGIFQGKGEGKMDPNGLVSREEAFSIMARIFKLEGDRSSLEKFKDGKDVSGWAKDSLSAMIKAGYIAGSEDKMINPKEFLTREQFAQILHNMVDTYGRQDLKDKEINGNLIVNNRIENLENLNIKGDLIIGEGLGFESLRMKNVRVDGRIVLRGGEEIRLLGKSHVEKILSLREDIRVLVENKDMIKDYEESINLELIGDLDSNTEDKPTEDNKPVEKPGKIEYYSGIKFDETKDILEDGRMREAKAEEFIDKMMENTKVYTKNGKHYIEYKKVDVPEGFIAGVTLDVITLNPNIDPIVLGTDPFFNVEENKIPLNEGYKKQLRTEAIKDSWLMTVNFAVVSTEYKGTGSAASVSYAINYNPNTKKSDIVIRKIDDSIFEEYDASHIFSGLRK